MLSVFTLHMWQRPLDLTSSAHHRQMILKRGLKTGNKLIKLSTKGILQATKLYSCLYRKKTDNLAYSQYIPKHLRNKATFSWSVICPLQKLPTKSFVKDNFYAHIGFTWQGLGSREAAEGPLLAEPSPTPYPSKAAPAAPKGTLHQSCAMCGTECALGERRSGRERCVNRPLASHVPQNGLCWKYPDNLSGWYLW